MTENERESLTRKVIEAQQKMIEVFQRTEEPEWMNSELTMPQFKILGLLYYHGPLRMSAIAEMLNKNMSTTTGVVDHLVASKLLRREEDPKDRRVVVVRLTEKGHDLCESFMQQGGRRMRALMERLNSAELEIILHSMELITRAAQAEYEERKVTGKAACEK